ncbi:MAG: hypothetical protein A2511_03715 [Deltaproteobacteria bacterium RIFOXYD12_FULL_50_9]|nr:MAG: hypothetical protein A2511_03715 [Deltaproteobacteria bacterium RIFOXYD12_FULL_50_9]
MSNSAKSKATGKWQAIIGRVVIALAIIIGYGTAIAEAVTIPPVVSGVTPTNNATPTWTWTPGGGGNGTYRYKLDAYISTGGAIETTATSFTPGDILGVKPRPTVMISGCWVTMANGGCQPSRSWLALLSMAAMARQSTPSPFLA